jgi:ribonuclease D
MLNLNNVKLQQFYLKCQKDKLIGIDTEFYRVNTYHPKLCLIQISNLSQCIIIDPICGKLEENFLKKLLFNQSITKIFFAASQDLEIFYKIFNKLPKPIFDLQLCISLLNKNSPLSYSSACRNFLAININKNNQFVDWRKRPLNKGKVMYAINDVKYLLPLYNKLNLKIDFTKKIIDLKKIHEKLVNPITYSEKPSVAWKKLRFIPKRSEDLDKLKRVCEIREKIAIKKNVPVKRIIKNFEIKLFFKNKSSLKLKTKIINKVQNIELKTILNNLI